MTGLAIGQVAVSVGNINLLCDEAKHNVSAKTVKGIAEMDLGHNVPVRY